MAKLADSTRRVYASGWKQWVLYNSGSRAPLFLDGEERSARQEDEQRLIRFVVFLHQVMKRSVGGIRQRLSAIRYAHISSGFPDPLVGRPRLWAAIAGLQRWEGAPTRKLPVTPSMLRWLIQHLDAGGFSAKDKVIIKGALLTGWFFMMRASELLPQVDGTDPLNRALRPADVAFYHEGKSCRGVHADEVVVQVKSSKNDQYGRGQARSHHRSKGDLCPVEALAAIQALFPHRWRSSEEEAPIFRLENGTGFDRESITNLVKIAALAAGFPSELAGSHSLRKGGATAFFATTGDLDRLKRFGGWTSNAVHAYLYEDHVAQKGISSGMLHSNTITMPSQKDPKARQTVNTAPGYVQSAVGAAPAPSQPEPASCRFGSTPSRAFSWAPDRKVRFGTQAGGMEEAPPPNEFNAANLFLCRNPDLDLWNFLGLSPGADQRSIMAAWRRRSRALHPDKVAESEKAAKEEEFKMLCAAKDILLNPIMRVQYTQWRANRTRRDVPSHQAAPRCMLSRGVLRPARHRVQLELTIKLELAFRPASHSSHLRGRPQVRGQLPLALMASQLQLSHLRNHGKRLQCTKHHRHLQSQRSRERHRRHLSLLVLLHKLIHVANHLMSQGDSTERRNLTQGQVEKKICVPRANFWRKIQNLLGSNHHLKVGPPSTHGRFRKSFF